MASSDGLQYRALCDHQKDQEEDPTLSAGDVLAVSRAGLPGAPDCKDGDERSPQGCLSGTKERGDFPGTYVQHLGPARIPAAAAKIDGGCCHLPDARWPCPCVPVPPRRGPPGQAELAERPDVPEQALPTVARLVEALEKKGIDGEAAYASPAGSLGDAELQRALLTDASAVDMDRYNARTLVEALMWYLQELPSPVIHPAVYSDLLYLAQGEVPLPQTVSSTSASGPCQKSSRLPSLCDTGPGRKRYYNILALLPGNFLL
ncbi:phosphatidylinositol 3-kinase regulatory subunit alpha-like [Rhea pennata]|uniref:phosphatidylinositol 3-kinase regulatory subunit alpha-like n=1 Tax=Rhea pennata TaxID=8795 RepID=UPI002E25DE59